MPEQDHASKRAKMLTRRKGMKFDIPPRSYFFETETQHRSEKKEDILTVAASTSPTIESKRITAFWYCWMCDARGPRGIKFQRKPRTRFDCEPKEGLKWRVSGRGLELSCSITD